MSLTPLEHEAITNAARAFNSVARVVGDGPSRSGDIAEAAFYVHGLQNMVLANAAAREYPDRYRLLGEDTPQ